MDAVFYQPKTIILDNVDKVYEDTYGNSIRGWGRKIKVSITGMNNYIDLSNYAGGVKDNYR